MPQANDCEQVVMLGVCHFIFLQLLFLTLPWVIFCIEMAHCNSSRITASQVTKIVELDASKILQKGAALEEPRGPSGTFGSAGACRDGPWLASVAASQSSRAPHYRSDEAAADEKPECLEAKIPPQQMRSSCANIDGGSKHGGVLDGQTASGSMSAQHPSGAVDSETEQLPLHEERRPTAHAGSAAWGEGGLAHMHEVTAEPPQQTAGEKGSVGQESSAKTELPDTAWFDMSPAWRYAIQSLSETGLCVFSAAKRKRVLTA